MKQDSNQKKISFILIAFLLTASSAIAQVKKISSIELSEIQSAYVDRPGDLYILQKSNSLKKYDSLGNLLFEKKYDKGVTLFDPRDGARMFLYQKENATCSFYSEEVKQVFPIEQQYAIEPLLACASGDNNIWLLDQADFSLKKINPSSTRVLLEANIDQKQFKQEPEFIYMREYQNFLFLHEKNSGILFFNSIGIQIQKISSSDITYFNFLGEELYYKKNGKLIFYDLYDSSTREEVIDPTCLFILLTDNRKYQIYSSHVDIYKKR